MITDEQKREIKRIAKKKRFINRKNKYIEHTLNNYLLDDFENDFDFSKYNNIKKYTEE